jgi:hypothetical protein
MISKFFIDRPVFASVISIIIVIAGLLAMRSLPVEQYPSIVPPEVTVSAAYPGASAESIASTVAAPLEQQINGVEKMLYMRSTSTGSGTLSIAITFAIGTDPDQATINVNNRVQRAMPLLPQEVQRLGVQVQKRSSSILEVIAMSSPGGRYDTIFVSNYALINVIDELRRTPGVGDATLFGASDYSMRVWLRPDKLAQYGLTPSDVAAAIREQNNQFAAGRFGEEPQRNKTAFTYSVSTQGRYSDPKEFEAGGGADRHLPAARRQRHPGDEGSQGDDGAARPAFPGGSEVRHSVHHHALRRGVDRGSRPDLHRGNHPRGPGDLPVPAEHPCDDHPRAGAAGVDHRNLRRDVCARILDQPPDAVRSGACHRHRRRRRHRRAGEYRAHHAHREASGA